MNDLEKVEQDRVEQMLADFDFEHTADVMRALNWKWKGERPTVYELIQTARELLYSVARENTPSTIWSHSIGGLEAEAWADTDGTRYYTLRFVVEESTSRDQE